MTEPIKWRDARKVKPVATIEVIQGAEGLCVTINDRRIAGPKPWGGGKVIWSWKTTVREINEAIRAPMPKGPRGKL
jgi:hypothetical protein